MDKIEIGEYARTDKGNIFIYANAVDENNNKLDYIYEKVKNKEYVNGYKWEKKWLRNENITKHSKNLIDLIEESDVLEIFFPIKKTTKKIYVDEYFKDSLILNRIMNKRIILKTVLTHEQYNDNCYRLEE